MKCRIELEISWDLRIQSCQLPADWIPETVTLHVTSSQEPLLVIDQVPLIETRFLKVKRNSK